MSVEMIFPKLIISGVNSLDYLKDLKGMRAFIVMSGLFAKSNSYGVSLITKYLTQAGFKYKIIYSQGQEPTLEYVRDSSIQLQMFAPDYIIAVGGGSTLDAAKIMKVLYEYPNISDRSLFDRFNLPPLTNRAKVVAIPTTSGTGSEVTPHNVVYIKSDNSDIPYIKSSVVDYQLIPDVVILDPSLTVSMPPSISASTGMDALVHAIEAYISKKPGSVFTDEYALKAIKLIFEYLPRAYKDSNDIEARTKMQEAATMAGIAIANKGTGLAHGTGQQLGPVFNVRHGLSVSIVLEAVMRFNYDECINEYLEISRYLGIDEGEKVRTIQKLFHTIKKLMDKIDFPTKIQDLGINKEDYISKIDFMAENALKNGATLTNPKRPTLEDAKKVFLSIC